MFSYVVFSTVIFFLLFALKIFLAIRLKQLGEDHVKSSPFNLFVDSICYLIIALWGLHLALSAS